MISLKNELCALLRGHGLVAEIRDEMVHVSSLDRWANLWMEQAERGTFLMELRATSSDDHVIADRWAAIGVDPQTAARDGLAAFCQGAFHVLLAALWGVLELDQVDHELRLVGDQSWDMYLGGGVMRASANVAPLVPPGDLLDRSLAAFDQHLTPGETHAMRVYLGVMNGQVTIEALVNDQASPLLAAAVSAAGWEFPASGFASFRWFAIARRRRGRPTHLVERTCGQDRKEDG